MTQLTDYPASQIFFSQRLRLHYVDWGNPTAPPLILVHGGRDHCRSWDWAALALKDRYHVIAPDLRGHGDSEWVNGSGYAMIDYVYDLAQLVRQKHLAPVTLLGHSLGGRICLEYAGIYPERVAKLIAIEGLGPSRRVTDSHSAVPAHQRMSEWISDTHRFAGRLPRRYPTLEDAVERMQEANPRLSAEQALHLTTHAVHQNEDGTFIWKFDNYARSSSPYPFNETDAEEIWSRVRMPTLLISGLESQGDPNEDERTNSFPHAQKVGVAEAGHWVHHDQLDIFLAAVQRFLGETPSGASDEDLSELLALWRGKRSNQRPIHEMEYGNPIKSRIDKLTPALDRVLDADPMLAAQWENEVVPTIKQLRTRKDERVEAAKPFRAAAGKFYEALTLK